MKETLLKGLEEQVLLGEDTWVSGYRGGGVTGQGAGSDFPSDRTYR